MSMRHELLSSLLGAYAAVATASIASRVITVPDRAILELVVVVGSAFLLALPFAVIALPLAFIGIWLVAKPVLRQVHHKRPQAWLAVAVMSAFAGGVYGFILGWLERNLLDSPTHYGIWFAAGVAGGLASGLTMFGWTSVSETNILSESL